MWHVFFFRRKYKKCWPHSTGSHGFFSADLKHLESLKRAGPASSVEETMKGKKLVTPPSHPCTLTHGLKVELRVSNTPSKIPNTFPKYQIHIQNTKYISKIPNTFPKNIKYISKTSPPPKRHQSSLFFTSMAILTSLTFIGR